MAQPQQPLAGADAIRALQDDDAIFEAFDSYPWTKDRSFLSGLYAILGSPNQQNPNASLGDMATHARIFYYAQRIGVQLDFARYQSWLSSHPDHKMPDILPPEYAQVPAAGETAPLDWQAAAPKAELYVDRKAAAAQSGDGDEPSYPMGFAEMIQLLQEGKPVPGIRQIPNTIIRDPAVKPVGARTVPRKPWERDNTANVAHSEGLKALDADFPPVNDS